MQTVCANFTVISAVAGKYPTFFYFFSNFFASFDEFGTRFVDTLFRERERERERRIQL